MIAQCEKSQKFKDYVKILIDSMKQTPMIVDRDGAVVSATDNRALSIYRIINFSQEVATRYGLSSQSILDASDLNNRLDRAIKGLETEIGLIFIKRKFDDFFCINWAKISTLLQITRTDKRARRKIMKNYVFVSL